MYAFAVHVDWFGGVLVLTDDAEVANAPATPLVGLDLDEWADVMDLSGTSTADGIGLDLPMPITDTPATTVLTDPGATPIGADVTVVRLEVVDGATDWNAARVLLRGYVDGYEVDTDTDLVALQVVPYEYEADRQVPAVLAEVDLYTSANPAGTWQDLDPATPTHRLRDGALGAVYPLIFGQPYAPGDTGVACTPAITLYEAVVGSSAETLLVSGDLPEDYDPDSSTVTVVWRGDEDGHATGISLGRRIDEQGRAVGTVSVTGAMPTEGVEYFIGWEQAFTRTTGLGSVLIGVLAESGLRFDMAAVRAALAELDRFKVSGYIDERTDVLSWLQDRVLGTLPVARTDVGDGLRLVPIRWDATAEDAQHRLTVGQGVDRSSGYRMQGAGRALRVKVRFARDAETDRYTAQVVRDEFAASVDTPGRPQRVKTVDLVDVFDEATADLVADFTLWRERPKVRADVLVAADLFGDLRAGDVVLLDDDEVGIAGRVCLVERITWERSPWVPVSLVFV